MKRSFARVTFVAIAVVLPSLGANPTASGPARAAELPARTAASAPAPPAEPARPAPNPERDVFFGQTHLHTSWSMDAYIIGNTMAGPEEAYQFALGRPVRHPGGHDVQLKRPLDFQGVTDHSEYMGMIPLANDPSSPISKLPIAEKLKVRSQADVVPIFKMLAGSLAKREPMKELLSPEMAGTVWKNACDIADKYYQPGTFTTFASYEWTSAPGSRNMHRNIFFKDSKKVPVVPYSAIDSDRAEDLWTWMEGQRAAGNECLAISHNANLSDGIMFPLEVDGKGRPIDAAWAQHRMNNEPLSEIHQLKGTSETSPELSPTDEFAGYELMSFLLGVDNSSSRPHGSYIREAYQNGLAMQQTRGYNPYKFGVVGASDSHNTVAPYSQSDNFGSHASLDATPEARIAGKVEAGMAVTKLSTSGLGGVWAEENTRESIFAAMRRKEVFGTSGVRIKVRLFGGWNYQANAVDQRDWVKAGYAGGVPMGGDLPAKSSKEPTFIVWAVKDPDDANLDRIQIVKGWTKDGQSFEKVFDVAWSGDRKADPATGKVPAVGSTVDIKEATYTNDIGAVELKKVWKDPEFDPSLHAFYYVRVLQIPTPRWSTYDAKKVGVAPPSEVPATVQERAWTSPIWYTPTVEETRKATSQALTVAALKQKGAVALDDAQLKELVVGKTVTVRNTVTGQRFTVLYGSDGKRVITGVEGSERRPGEMFGVLHSGNPGVPAPYEIVRGSLSTTLEGVPFEVTVYKAGGEFIAARGNEFGYANYRIEQVR
jgi:hypothetical protein